MLRKCSCCGRWEAKRKPPTALPLQGSGPRFADMKMLPISKASRELTQALAEANGEPVTLTRHGRPVAEVRSVALTLPYPKGSPERSKAVQEMMRALEKGFDLGLKGRRFTRDEMHER